MTRTNHHRRHNNNSRQRSGQSQAAAAYLVPDAKSYNDFRQQCIELDDALDTIHNILSHNPPTSSSRALALKQHTSISLPTTHPQFGTNAGAKSNIALTPLKLIYFGDHGLLVLMFAPLNPQTTPTAHSWLPSVLWGMALISSNSINTHIIKPMEAWCMRGKFGGKRLRDEEDEEEGVQNKDNMVGSADLKDGTATNGTQHRSEAQTKYLRDTVLQPLRVEMLQQHDYLLYSVIGAVNTTGNVEARGEAAMREYMTRWKISTRAAFPVPSTSTTPITTHIEYEEVVMKLQAGCPDLNDEVIEWPIHGPSHPFMCQVQHLGKRHFASEFPE